MTTDVSQPSQVGGDDVRANVKTRRGLAQRWALPNERQLLSGLFKGLLGAVAIFLVLDFQTILERASVPLPGESERTEPLVMPPPKPKDHVRPYLPKAMPMRRKGQPPRLPGYAKTVPSNLMAQNMVFKRGKSGHASAVGRIEPGTAARFDDFLTAQGDEVKALYLHSPGGSVRDALLMSARLRKKGINTVVPANAYCASSCPIILAGGAKRVVGNKAWVGVHRVFTSEAEQGDMARGMSEAQAITAEIQQHLRDMGVKPDVWLHAMRTPSENLYVFTRAQLADYRLVSPAGSS